MAIIFFTPVIELVTKQSLGLGIILSLIYAAFVDVKRVYFHPLSSIPGPRLAAATGWYEVYYDVVTGGTYVKEYARMHKKYGPIIRASPNHVHVNDTDFYKKVFNTRTLYKKEPDFYGRLGASNSIAGIMDPEQHRVHRRLLNPIFSKRYINTLSPLVAEKLEVAMGVMEERCKMENQWTSKHFIAVTRYVEPR